MTTANDTQTTKQLLAHLWRGGLWAYYWTNADRNGKKRSFWLPTENPAGVPASWAGCNVYFSVHPCTQIPATNASGESTDPEFVRGQVDHVAAINCLFAEFDAMSLIK